MNRRLGNQAFFTAIYVDEVGEPRITYQHPCGPQCDTEVHGKVLTWATGAKKGTRFKPDQEWFLLSRV